MGPNKYYCKIDGKVYNLKKVQDIIDENPENPDTAKIYIMLYKEFKFSNSICNMLSLMIKETKEIPADYNESLKELQERNRARLGITNVPQKKPRCPRCGSTDIETLHRSFDNFRIVKNRCNSCGETWRK